MIIILRQFSHLAQPSSIQAAEMPLPPSRAACNHAQRLPWTTCDLMCVVSICRQMRMKQQGRAKGDNEILMDFVNEVDSTKQIIAVDFDACSFTSFRARGTQPSRDSSPLWQSTKRKKHAFIGVSLFMLCD